VSNLSNISNNISKGKLNKLQFDFYCIKILIKIYYYKMEFDYKDLHEFLENTSKNLTQLPTMRYPLGKITESVALQASSRMVKLYEKILSLKSNINIVKTIIIRTLTDIKRDYELVIYLINDKSAEIYFVKIHDKEEILKELNVLIKGYIDIVDLIIQLTYYIDKEEDSIKIINYLLGVHGNVITLAEILKSLNKSEETYKDILEEENGSYESNEQ